MSGGQGAETQRVLSHASPSCNNSAVQDICLTMTRRNDRGPEAAKAEEAGLGFERCFRDHYADILAFALRRIAGRQAAEDAASETFAVVWRHRDQIPDPPLPWLYAIAVRVIANQRRSVRRRGNLEQRLAHEAGTEAPAPEPNEAVHLRTDFATAFQLLSQSEREVLSLIAWDGLTPREAAVVLDCSYGAFRVRFHRARRKLRKHLAASGHLPHDGPIVSPDPAEEIS